MARPQTIEKGPPHQAGTAHPIPSGNAAENRFGDVAQERADYKQQKDFVKAAPGSKHRDFGALGAYQVQLRGLGAHAALGAVKNPQPHPQRQVGKAVVDLVHSGQLERRPPRVSAVPQQINDQQKWQRSTTEHAQARRVPAGTNASAAAPALDGYQPRHPRRRKPKGRCTHPGSICGQSNPTSGCGCSAPANARQSIPTTVAYSALNKTGRTTRRYNSRQAMVISSR